MANSFSWTSNNTLTGNISSLSNLSMLSTGMTYTFQENPEDERERKKREIKSMIGDDKYLLQELLTELRKEKLDQLKNVSKI